MQRGGAGQASGLSAISTVKGACGGDAKAARSGKGPGVAGDGRRQEPCAKGGGQARGSAPWPGRECGGPGCSRRCASPASASSAAGLIGAALRRPQDARRGRRLRATFRRRAAARSTPAAASAGRAPARPIAPSSTATSCRIAFGPIRAPPIDRETAVHDLLRRFLHLLAPATAGHRPRPRSAS